MQGSGVPPEPVVLPAGPYVRFGKRAADVVFSLAALVLLSPVIAVVALIVRVGLGSPVLFAQSRPGRNGHPFTLRKFRTMTDARDESGELLSDRERLTGLGRFLRSTSLDELPELWNVACGDMSLVGPRPLLTEYLAKYSVRQHARHHVRPGLTGWAQVSGRNGLDWPERLDLDVWYVQNISPLLDLKILWRTIWAVVRREGISAEGDATMPKFEG